MAVVALGYPAAPGKSPSRKGLEETVIFRK
jgi:hypothetical protein